MEIAPISAELQAAVAQIHEQTHSRKADAYILCEATFNLARELHDDAAFIAVAIDYALVIDQQGYPERSINILYEALQLAQSYHLFQEEGRLLIAIGRSGYTRAEYSLAIQAWAQAVEKAGKTDTDDVSKALKSNKFETVLGNIGFDAKGDVTAPGYVFYIWKDGKYDYVQ